MNTSTMFGERLKALRGRMGLTQTQFGERIHRDQSDIAKWEKSTTYPSLQDLENIRDAFDPTVLRFLLVLNHEYSHDGIHWVESTLTAAFSEDQLRRVRLGIDFFRTLVVDNLDLGKCAALAKFRDYKIPDLYAAYQTAVQLGALRIVSVPRNQQLENQLRAVIQRMPAYKNHEFGNILVADIPGNYDGSPIRADFVAFLAAQEIFSRLGESSAYGSPQARIALGSGYTVRRVAQQSANLRWFDGVEWYSLIGYDHEYPVPHSANAIVAELTSLHPGSKGWLMPPPSPQSNGYIRDVLHTRFSYLLNAAIVTVNGYTADSRNYSTSSSQTLVDGYSSLWPHSPGDLYMKLRREPEIEHIAGEMLGVLLDDDGQHLQHASIDEKQFSARFNYQDLSLYSNRVWLVASMQFKARAVLMALKLRLVGHLVIDSSIAEWLIALEAK